MSSHHGDSGCIALSSLPVCFALAPALRGFIVVHPLSPRACMLVPRTVATLSHTHGLSACYPSHLVMSSHHGDSGSIALSSLPVYFALTPALRGFVITSSPSPRPCMLPPRTIASPSPSHCLSACYPSHLALPSHHGDSSCIALSSLHVCFALTLALRGFIFVSLLSPRACVLVSRIFTYVRHSSDSLLCLFHTHTAIQAKVPRQFHSSTLHGPLGFSSSPSLRTTLIRAQSPCR